MLRELKIKGITWIDGYNLEKKEIYNVLKEHDFHELDIEACMEENQRARIDSYEDYFFMVLHFPKYIVKTKTYELNEFNIFLKKDLLITFRNFPGIHIDKIFTKYEKQDFYDGEHTVLYSGYILYEIIEAMLEKIFNSINNSKKDINLLEKLVFEKVNYKLINDIMIKKRNIIFLKHMFLPQVSVMRSTESNINKIFKGEIEEYFEDLEDKVLYINDSLNILEEHITSIEDAFKSIVDMNMNYVMKILTFFSALILPLTLITSFYGMNVDLPMQKSTDFVYFLLALSTFVMVILYVIMKKKGKF
ncbi:MAG: magnesium transporter CorA family protein [Candidatus Gracilibacteria bacterium]|nr:magnesium transporter CorA family protein [Candidatus Gracilibacteria bacterium]